MISIGAVSGCLCQCVRAPLCASAAMRVCARARSVPVCVCVDPCQRARLCVCVCVSACLSLCVRARARGGPHGQFHVGPGSLAEVPLGPPGRPEGLRGERRDEVRAVVVNPVRRAVGTGRGASGGQDPPHHQAARWA